MFYYSLLKSSDGGRFGKQKPGKCRSAGHQKVTKDVYAGVCSPAYLQHALWCRSLCTARLRPHSTVQRPCSSRIHRTESSSLFCVPLTYAFSSSPWPPSKELRERTKQPRNLFFQTELPNGRRGKHVPRNLRKSEKGKRNHASCCAGKRLNQSTELLQGDLLPYSIFRSREPMFRLLTSIAPFTGFLSRGD
jgi:hypothetical protein